MHALQEMLSYLYRFSVFVWTSENNWSTLRVDAYFFENGGKKISVFENIRVHVDRASVVFNSGKQYQTRSPEWPLVVF